ncbi:MAG: DUF721 domain-containing protein [Bacteroidales bacterium]|jgi:predicted nucleic acid-binding Zn ribbon protein|nr:DUF721 domain-containing protein [Bacteroidales bacterium]
MRYHNEYSLEEAIAAFLEKYHLQEAYTCTLVANIWKESVGKMIASYTRKVELNKHTLIIYVTSPTVKQELMMLKTDIIKQINKATGEELIKKIEIR